MSLYFIIHQIVNICKNVGSFLPRLDCTAVMSSHTTREKGKERKEINHTPTPNSTVTQRNVTNMALKSRKGDQKKNNPNPRLVRLFLDERRSAAVRTDSR